jgi:hypothetical protein
LSETSLSSIRIRVFVFALIATMLFSMPSHATSAPEYAPNGSVRDYFLGAWKLVSTENKYPDGHTTPYAEFGPDATGFLMYTASGHMCAELMKRGRHRWADDNTPTGSEAAEAFDGFFSYCGTFELRERDHVMVHHPETSASPNWVGTSQERPYYLVSENRFFFRGQRKEKQKDGTELSVTWTITWERLK